MRGHGMGRAPIFRGPPVVRGLYMRPYVRRTSGFLGLLTWLFPGFAGFWLGKSYGESQQTIATREADLQQRAVDLQNREAELRRREAQMKEQVG